MKKKILFFTLLLLALLLFYQYKYLQKLVQQKTTTERFISKEWTGETMGTSYSIKIYVPISTNASLFSNLQATLQTLPQKIKNHLKRINLKMSTYDPSSEISKLNAFPVNKPFTSSPELLNLILYANHFSKLSDGYYDITLGSLINHWGFGSRDKGNLLPLQTEVQTLPKNKGYQFLTINKKHNQISKSLAGLQIDLSSIAKGYAVDEISKLLNEYQLTNHLIEIGGEITINGYKYKKKNQQKKMEQTDYYPVPWQIGISQPKFNSSTLNKVIPLGAHSLPNHTINSIATSGDYQNFIYQDKQKYSHVLDGKTGFPTTNKVTSITVLSTNCTTADALATMLIAMPFKDSLALAEKENLLVYYLYYEKGKLKKKTTSQLKHYLKNKKLL